MKVMKLIAIGLIGIALYAQSGRREFDVASVRPSKEGVGGGGGLARTPGGLTATGYEFRNLLEMAYQTRQIEFARVPDSLRSARFDITAKASGRISGDQYWEMLQTLLEDRFKLAYHRETKDAQVYALTLAKRGGDLGPKLSRSKDPDCPVNPDGANFCGVNPRPGLISGQRVPMTRIARELSPFAGRPVLDETRLTGAFDFQLTWTPDQSLSNGDGDKLNKAGITIDPIGPSFFSAIQEQLGLKLESKKGQIEILVIDRAEPPGEN